MPASFDPTCAEDPDVVLKAWYPRQPIGRLPHTHVWSNSLISYNLENIYYSISL